MFEKRDVKLQSEGVTVAGWLSFPSTTTRGRDSCARSGSSRSLLRHFTKSLTLPGFTVRAAATKVMNAEEFVDFELNMGAYIGLANQKAAS